MGAGVPSGLQNQFEGLGASWVGSIPTYSRHLYLWQEGFDMDNKQELLKQLPKVDEVLSDQRLSVFFEDTARELVVEAVREEIDRIRQRILQGSETDDQQNQTVASIDDYESILKNAMSRIKVKRQKSLRKVINGTGTIVHTNLGRAKLSEETLRCVAEVASHYSTLEYDLQRGARGSRHDHTEKLLSKILGTEAAMAVNNNAAATLLCLSALADGKDVIVSRGELVEIGGSFRIPEIMKQGGARLVEVGTTNKTKIADYRNAIVEGQTGILLKVHTSNYKIMGFTAEASLTELVELGREKGVPVVYDMGSGLMVDLQQYGVDEPTVPASLNTGIDVILFSGDKLLGGPQAGIIAGKKEYIERMKQHPLARVVRLDKMTLAALEATFREYLDPEQAKERIPVLSMVTQSPDQMKDRAERFLEMILQRTDAYVATVIASEGQVGGGSTPNQFLPGFAVAIVGKEQSPDRIERSLRAFETPIIARIYKDQLLIDMRTLEDEDLPVVADALSFAARGSSGGGHYA